MTDLERIVQLHYRRVLLRFRNLVTDANTAEDLTQEVFFRFHDARTRGRRIDDAGQFLSGVALNVFREYLRQKKRRDESSLTDGPETAAQDPNPRDTAEQEEQGRRLRQALTCLDPDDQTLVLAVFYFNMTAVQIGEWLRIPRTTVTSRLHRALDRIRHHLGESMLNWSNSHGTEQRAKD